MAEKGTALPGPSQDALIQSEGTESRNGDSSMPVLPVDSAVTQAEKIEKKRNAEEESVEPSAKRVRVEDSDSKAEVPNVDARQKTKGIAMVKAELDIYSPFYTRS